MTAKRGIAAPGITALLLVVVTACAPRAGELRGTPSPERLPAAVLPPGREKVTFHWEYRDRDMTARGDGLARVAPPDSARLDFAVSGGLGSGYAWLLDDTVVSPEGGNRIRRYLPSAALLWAALGRLALPATTDTAVRIEGDTLRADLGGGQNVWRVGFAGPRLVGLERLSGGRVRETVVRKRNDDIRFENPAAGRSLTLTHVRGDTVADFDPQIWRR